MATVSVHERLRRAREASGLDLAMLARRSGIRVEHLRAIEDGRFADLPRGIYARAAVRAFALASGLDPRDVLAECEALLPGVEDPILALGRRRGLRPAHDAIIGRTMPRAEPGVGASIAAAALDACLAGGLVT